MAVWVMQTTASRDPWMDWQFLDADEGALFWSRHILLQMEHTAHDDLSRGARRRQRVNGDGDLGIS